MNKKVYYILLFLIIIFGLFLRLKYTNFHIELSSDEGESLLLAKSIFTGSVLLQWSYYRPFLLPLLWGILFKLGFEETAIHLTVIIFSLIGIFYICLLGEYLFNKKILLITGGTGSFGNAVLNRFLDTDIKEIRIFSFLANSRGK